MGIREKEHKTLSFQRKFKEHFIYFLYYFFNTMLEVSAPGFPVKLGMTQIGNDKTRKLFMKLLEIKNLSVESREDNKKILENVSFEIDKKSIHILIGANGSGKSTLAYALMGLPRFKITSGKILLLGKDITKLSTDKRAKTGMTLAFQEPALFEGISVEDFLKAGNKKLNKKEIERVLFLTGLEPKKFIGRKIDQTLSGGERKRIELASVIALKPKLIILDEPDAGLDIIIYRELYGILGNIKQETGASILLISHREELGLIADQATFLRQGKIVCSGPFRPVMRKYCQSLTKRKICLRKFCLKNL